MHIEQLIASASNLQNTGELEHSLALWKKVLAIDPGHLDALSGAAKDCMSLGEIETAISFHQRLLESHATHLPTHVTLAKLFQSRQEHALSAQRWKSAMQLKPLQPNFTLFYLRNLILAQDTSYHHELEICEQRLAAHDRGYTVIANVLAQIGDDATECELLQRGSVNAKLPQERFRLARRLVRQLWVAGKITDIDLVLDAVYLQDQTSFIQWLASQTFATPVFPAEADWLCRNEQRLFDNTDSHNHTCHMVFARAFLWKGEKGLALERYKAIRNQLQALVSSENYASQDLLYFIECCIETAEFDQAETGLLELIAKTMSQPTEERVRQLFPFVSILAINGYRHVKDLASALVERFLAAHQEAKAADEKESPALSNQYGYCLAELSIKCGLNQQARQLYDHLLPDPGHWFSKWTNRTGKNSPLADNAKTWSPLSSKNNASLKYLGSRGVNALPAGSLPLFAKFKNETKRVPGFLDYYRVLGVTHFFMIDNESSDGATDLLVNEPDVSLWRASGSLESNLHCVPWINGLIDQYSSSHWCTHVDLDEYLDFEGSAAGGSLLELANALEQQGADILPAFMLDMYPANSQDIRSPQPTEDLTSLHPWFDNNYRFLGMRRPPYLQAVGGFRSRMWPGLCGDTLNKVPLFKAAGGIRPVNANHDTNGGRPAQQSALLRHYRFSDDVYQRKKFSDYISKTNTSLENLGADGNSLNLLGPDSVKYESSEQLLSLGLINVLNWAVSESDYD